MQKQIYRILSGNNYLKTLAEFISEKSGGNNLELTNSIVILPNRRSALKIKEYFLEASSNKVSFLPKIISIGDINEDNFDYEIEFVKEFKSIKPAISSEERMFIISKLIRDNANKFNLEKINFEASLKLAISLANLLDDMQKHNVNHQLLANILPEELASHRQLSLEFINYIFEEYPKILLQKNLIDVADRLNQTLDLYSNFIQNNHGKKIFIAGSTGSIPATSKLIKAIYDSNGYVVLPFIDDKLGEDVWNKISNSENSTHHQKQIFNLLNFLEVNRSEIKLLGDKSDYFENREVLLSDIFIPVSSLNNWQKSSYKNYNFDFFKLIEAENISAEAKLVSIIINQKLSEEKSVSVVTNNKNLIEKISFFCKKYNIEIDNSFGEILANSREGGFFIDISELFSNNFSIIKLLNVLKQAQLDSGFNNKIYSLEKQIIRKNNIKNISQLKNFIDECDLEKIKLADDLLNLINDFYNIYLKAEGCDDISALIGYCFEIVNLIIPSLDLAENENWQSINNLLLGFSSEKNIYIEKDLFSNSIKILLSSKKVWNKYKFGKNIVALSPIEARLQNFDCVILADIAQGTWPEEKFSPWLSRGMFKQMDFTPAEDYLSLSAHDFVAQLSNSEVFITRSKYKNGEPTIESCLINRIKTFYKLINRKELKPCLDYNYTLENLDGNFTEPKTYNLPYPKPFKEARIDRLSVTDIEKLVKNPYNIYCSKILKLNKLDDLEREISVADYGNFCHKVLEIFSNIHQLNLDKVNSKNFDLAINQSYEFFEKKNAVQPAWKNQILQIKNWFLELEKMDLNNLSKLISESKIEYKVNHNFTLVCKADRIELSKENKISIADYKTGKIPSKSEVERLISPQLLLAAYIAKNNGFKEINKEYNVLDEVIYYNFSLANYGPEKKVYELDVESLVQDVDIQLNNLIVDLKNPDKPFLINPNPDLKLEYDDYTHLSRAE